MIYVYTQPGCAPCTWAIQRLEESSVDFLVFDITEDEDALGFITTYAQAKSTPVFARYVTRYGFIQTIKGYGPEQVEKLEKWIEESNPNIDEIEDGIWLD